MQNGTNDTMIRNDNTISRLFLMNDKFLQLSVKSICVELSYANQFLTLLSLSELV